MKEMNNELGTQEIRNEPAICLPTEYQCTVCRLKTRRPEHMTSLAWIRHVAEWAAEHRKDHGWPVGTQSRLGTQESRKE